MRDVVHVSVGSRYDRELSDWVVDLPELTQGSLLSVTNTIDIRGLLSGLGWSYHAFAESQVGLACLVAWDTKSWQCSATADRLLSSGDGKPLYVTHAVLRAVDDNRRLLLGSTSFPAHIEGDEGWEARKSIYAYRLSSLASLLAMWERRISVDAILLSCDWNLNLKEDWVRDLISGNLADYRLGWETFPTGGTGISSSVEAPAGVAGISDGERVITGSLTKGLEVYDIGLGMATEGEHRGYVEGYEWSGDEGVELNEPYHASGDIKPGDPWWGFGDTLVDELYSPQGP